jgi:hypothetical protein
MRIRRRPRKRWIVDIEEDTQVLGIRWHRKKCKERQDGRVSLRGLKLIVGCNASERKKKVVQRNSSLTPVLNGGERSASCLGSLNPRERFSSTL